MLKLATAVLVFCSTLLGNMPHQHTHILWNYEYHAGRAENFFVCAATHEPGLFDRIDNRHFPLNNIPILHILRIQDLSPTEQRIRHNGAIPE